MGLGGAFAGAPWAGCRLVRYKSTASQPAALWHGTAYLPPGYYLQYIHVIGMA